MEVDQLNSKILTRADSDCTLVGDSDEDILEKTSIEKNYEIINETDETSNDTVASALRGNIDDELNVLSFTEMVELQSKCLSQVRGSFDNPAVNKTILITPKFRPPSRKLVEETAESYKIAKFDNIAPFFSRREDVPAHPQNEACISAKVKSRGLASLEPFRSGVENVTGVDKWRRMKVKEFNFSGQSLDTSNLRKELAGQETVVIQPIKLPPDKQAVERWLEDSCDDTLIVSHDSSVTKPQIAKQNETVKLMGVTCGQIECVTRTSINPEDDNLGKAKALTTVDMRVS